VKIGVRPVVAFALGAILAITSKNTVREPVVVALDTATAPPKAIVTEGPPLPLGRGSHAAGTIDGHVIVVGGTNWNQAGTKKTFLSDGVVFAANAWQRGPSIRVPLAEGAYADDGHALYLAGGLESPDRPSAKVFRIALDANGQSQVSELPSLPQAISACAAVVFSGNLYVACGTTSPGKSSTTLWSLDLSKPTSNWRNRAELPGVGRGYPALVDCGSFIYLFGGLREEGNSIHERTLSDAYRYDPATNQWNLLGQLPVPGYCWSAQPVDDSHILLAGRADGSIHDEIWLISVPAFDAQIVGRVIQKATCAPLVNVARRTWWLIGGEPDSNKHRTNRISVISLP
jgi:N-acetylneuraminic acid mutarotase